MPKLSQTIYNAKIVCRKINQNEKMKEGRVLLHVYIAQAREAHYHYYLNLV